MSTDTTPDPTWEGTCLCEDLEAHDPDCRQHHTSDCGPQEICWTPHGCARWLVARVAEAEAERIDLRARLRDLHGAVRRADAERDRLRGELDSRPSIPDLTPNTRYAPCVDCEGLILVDAAEAGKSWRCGKCGKSPIAEPADTAPATPRDDSDIWYYGGWTDACTNLAAAYDLRGDQVMGSNRTVGDAWHAAGRIARERRGTPADPPTDQAAARDRQVAAATLRWAANKAREDGHAGCHMAADNLEARAEDADLIPLEVPTDG
jgi:hypothetical protein